MNFPQGQRIMNERQLLGPLALPTNGSNWRIPAASDPFRSFGRWFSIPDTGQSAI